MNNTDSLWMARFKDLDEIEVRRRATLPGIKPNNLRAVDTYRISDVITQTLNSLYLPTDDDIAIIRQLIDIARSHSSKYYESRQRFLEALYSAKSPLDKEFQPPTLLSGPAGVGKSSLMKALTRVLFPIESLDIGPGHAPFAYKPIWHIQVRDRASFSSMIHPFVQSRLGNTRRVSSADLSELATKAAHTDGTSLILLDEMQFLTQSAGATNLITKSLYQFSYLGVPVVFAANYGLWRSLLKRQEQDTQRLLTSPIVLLPSEQGSEDWNRYLKGVENLLDGTFSVDLQEHSSTIYQLTAGLKRLFIQLTRLAYSNVWKQGRRQVMIEDLANSYDSVSYASSRRQVAAMLTIHPTKQSAQYQCPIPLPPIVSTRMKEYRESIRHRELTQAIQHDIRTPNERELAAKAAEIADPIKSTKPRKANRRKPLTAAELMQNGQMRRGLYPPPGRPE